MEIWLTNPIGIMPALVDADSRTTEAIDVDRIELASIVINSVTGVAQFALLFGGVDSRGRFHMAHEFMAAAQQITIQRQSNVDQWDKLFGPGGRCKANFPEEFFVELMPSLIQAAVKQDWGARFPDHDIAVNGKVVDCSHVKNQAPRSGMPHPAFANLGTAG